MNEVEEKHKTSVNNVSEESQVSPVTDLKRHLLVLPYQGQKDDFIITLRKNYRQRHRGLTLLDLPLTSRRSLFLESFLINVFPSVLLLIYLSQVSILT